MKNWTTCWPPVPLAVAGKAISKTLTCVNLETRPQAPIALEKVVGNNRKRRDFLFLVTFNKIPKKQINSSKNPPVGRRAAKEPHTC